MRAEDQPQNSKVVSLFPIRCCKLQCTRKTILTNNLMERTVASCTHNWLQRNICTIDTYYSLYKVFHEDCWLIGCLIDWLIDWLIDQEGILLRNKTQQETTSLRNQDILHLAQQRPRIGQFVNLSLFSQSTKHKAQGEFKHNSNEFRSTKHVQEGGRWERGQIVTDGQRNGDLTPCSCGWMSLYACST